MFDSRKTTENKSISSKSKWIVLAERKKNKKLEGYDNLKPEIEIKISIAGCMTSIPYGIDGDDAGHIENC